MTGKTTLALWTMAALLAGCSTVPTAEPQESGAAKAIRETLQQAAKPAAIASSAPSRPVSAPAAVDAKPEHTFDVDSDGTPAQAFFMALVDETDDNIVVHPDVSGSISLMLKNVTVAEVLDVVSEVYGYSYRKVSAGYMVFPAALQTRIYQIDYLDLQRSGVSRTLVSSGQVSENRNRLNNIAGGVAGGALAVPAAGFGGGFGGGLGAGMAGGMGPGGLGGALGQQQISGSNIDTMYQTDFWTDLTETLEAMLAGDAGSQVVVNSQTGVVVVRAMPDKLRSVSEYLAMIQDVAQRQVVLEAKIVEVQLNDTFRAGINWFAVAQNSDGYTTSGGQLAPPAGFSGNPDALGGRPNVIGPGNVLESLESSTLGGAFTLAFDIGDFNAFLELLELQGETRVLSSPRVSTLNNQKAVIKAGTDEFFVTNVASNTVTGASSTTSRDVELTPFFSGIALDVTPQISSEGEVTLHIHPTVSEVTDQQKNLTVSGETDILPLAFSEVRESDSIVKAKSGQIIVIGGLMRESRVDQDFRTPVLGRLPGIGNLFRSRSQTEQKTELVILLKPIVVDSDDDWRSVTGESLARMGGK